jgi:L-rhamnose mutarotase
MMRKAFVMSLNEGEAAEYIRRHEAIDPELERVLKDHGVRKYSIFLQSQTRQLFAYVEIESDEKWASIADTDACKSWWRYMADIMPHNSDNSPTAFDLEEVFHLA